MPEIKIIGHDKVKEYLICSQTKGLLNHAYLLIGPEGVGKRLLVDWFVSRLLCENNSACGYCQSCSSLNLSQSSDVLVIEKSPDKQDITINQIRAIKKFINLGSLTGNWRVVIIDGAHYLNQESSNALLKSLEEPVNKVIFFLLSSHPTALLPTIKSRCFIIQLGLVKKKEIENLLPKYLSPSQIRLIASLSGGRPGKALRLINNPEILNKSLECADLLLNFLKNNQYYLVVNYLESEFKEQTGDQSTNRQKAQQLILVWQSVVRDIIFQKLGLDDYIIYQTLKSNYEKLNKLRLLDMYLISKLLQRAQEKILNNANIRLTLEWICYNFLLFNKDTSFQGQLNNVK